MCMSDLSGGHLLQTQLLPASAPNGEKAGYVLDFISSVHQMCLNSCDFKIEYYISFNVFLWSCSQGWGVTLVTYMWKHRGRVSEWSMWWTPITDTTTTVLPYWHQIVSVAYPSRPTVDSSISADSSNSISGLSQQTYQVWSSNLSVLISLFSSCPGSWGQGWETLRIRTFIHI